MLPYRSDLKEIARQLRRNMTDAERRIWSRLRGKQLLGLQFYRQKNIGDYIVDFYCPAAKLIIEIDGSQHFEEKGLSHDSQRDTFLKNLGFTIMRFNNLEITSNLQGVLDSIYNFMQENPPQPPFKKGGNNNFLSLKGGNS